MSQPSSGTQYEIVYGNQRAVVTEVGATLRSYQVAGHDVVTSFDEDSLPVGCQGQHLLPWPNRIRDGRYDWDGETQQLPINELDRHTALHGLLNWVPWSMAELYPSAVRLRTTLFPRPGWPGVLRANLTHWLDEQGLSVELVVSNEGNRAFPFGYAAHPYFTLDAPLDEVSVTVPFNESLATDERQLPTELIPVDSGQLAGGPLGSANYDTAFCNPLRDATGHWTVRLSHQERFVEVWADETMGWLQLYTPASRRSLAVEPMTCGPDAFNEGPTHQSLITLAPGETASCRWGVRAN